MNKKKLFGAKGCLGCLGTIFGSFVATAAGDTAKGSVSDSDVIMWIAVIIAGLVALGYMYHKSNAKEMEIIKKRKEEINKLKEHYNSEVKELIKSSRKSLATRTESSDAYSVIDKEYEKAKNEKMETWNQEGKLKLNRIWQLILSAGFIVLFLGGCFSLGLDMDMEEPNQMTALMESRSWNAENIPMPHMQDHSLYVSNPDSILSEEVVDSINKTLGMLDDVLDIESVMAIVGHIEGDDPVALVRGIYDKYKVGRNDRGLVIVVGYLDHSYFIAPGRSLEGDLTDLECNHLAQDYLIPSMKAEKPDSGMLYLAKGVYALMAQKDMPKMSALTSSTSNEEEGIPYSIIFLSLLFVGWSIFSVIMKNKINPASGSHLMANPFIDYDSGSGSSSSGWSGGGSSYSGGGSSGGFGGGSWGGGGSGGRW